MGRYGAVCVWRGVGHGNIDEDMMWPVNGGTIWKSESSQLDCWPRENIHPNNPKGVKKGFRCKEIAHIGYLK